MIEEIVRSCEMGSWLGLQWMVGPSLVLGALNLAECAVHFFHWFIAVFGRNIGRGYLAVTAGQGTGRPCNRHLQSHD